MRFENQAKSKVIYGTWVLRNQGYIFLKGTTGQC